MTTCGWVSIEGVPGPTLWLAEYDPISRWNGWLAAPHFDPLAVVAVLDYINDEQPEYGYDWTFEDDGTLVLEDRYYRDEYPDDAEPERIAPTADGLYTLGAFGWVWLEADDERHGPVAWEATCGKCGATYTPAEPRDRHDGCGGRPSHVNGYGMGGDR